MRTLLAIALVVLSLSARAEDGFQTATILDAGTHTETSGAVIIPGAVPTIANAQANVSAVTLRIGDLIVTADYKTVFKNGANAASALIVGDTVQAKIDGKKLLFVLPNGHQIKADIIRRERRDVPAASVAK